MRSFESCIIAFLSCFFGTFVNHCPSVLSSAFLSKFSDGGDVFTVLFVRAVWRFDVLTLLRLGDSWRRCVRFRLHVLFVGLLNLGLFFGFSGNFFLSPTCEELFFDSASSFGFLFLIDRLFFLGNFCR